MAIGADESAAAGQYLPARMLNEFTYCPRLFYLEWVQGEFEDNPYTVEGRHVHRRVDKGRGAMPAPEEERPFETRSVALSSAVLGLSAKIDLVEGEGGRVSPVDYKRGAPPDNPWRAWEPERVQLCAYGLLLREHGYTCEGGVLYFAQTRERVEVPFDEVLVARTKSLLEEARRVAASSDIPPPLVASPKCGGCSLQPICLPDEVNHLRPEPESREGEGTCEVRLLVPARDDARPLYVQEQGARLGLSGEVLEARGRERESLGEVRLSELSHVVLMGNVQVTTQALRELLDRSIPVCWMSYGGWLSGFTEGLGHKNITLRRAQYRAAEDAERSLALARRFVRTKVANCRTLLRRNGEAGETVLRELAQLVHVAGEAPSLEVLLGVEGNAARLYFGNFASMLRPEAQQLGFDFTTRSRRPPRDPVNALLSLAYTLLAKELSITARTVGLEPYLGFYHQPRYGRPALALDLMEEFRPLVADSVVINAINTAVVTPGDFLRHPTGVALLPEPRKRFIRAYERRLDELVTHPTFGYRISYRRVLEVQCRLLARHLMGELPEYPEFRTR